MVCFLASSPSLISGGREDHPGMFLLNKLGLLLLIWFDLNYCVTGETSVATSYLLNAWKERQAELSFLTPHMGD